MADEINKIPDKLPEEVDKYEVDEDEDEVDKDKVNEDEVDEDEVDEDEVDEDEVDEDECDDEISIEEAINRKESWPELVGMPGKEAKIIIEKTNPGIKVWLVPRGGFILCDILDDRVQMVLDSAGNVAKTPYIM